MDESRREFLKAGAKAVAVVTAADRLRAWNTPRTVLGANDRVRVAIVGTAWPRRRPHSWIWSAAEC